jgi:hypothetical protein
MRILIASATLAAALFAVPQLAMAQANFGYNAAPYCLQNPDGSANCSYQSMNGCLRSKANVSPNMRCIENPRSGANRVFRQVEPLTSGQGVRRR